uniref:Kell metallo-endopeptidase (Kell blood group) n=1 Tax=Esox lucius TaxID=8010 RepID=A0AAY5L8G0_ESOLU
HQAEEWKPQIWKRHHILLLLLGSSFCLSILGLIYFFHQHPPVEKPPASTPCTSPACQRVATRLAVTVDPFTFYPQAVAVLALSESEDCSSPGDSAKQKACRFYRSCMDIGPTENAGPEPFLWLVHQLGGWAVSGPWNQTDFNSTLHLLMRDYATFPFFNVYVGKDPNDTQGDKMYIQILRPFLASCQKLLDLLGFPFSSTSIHVGLFISLSSELAVEASPLAHRLERGLLYQRLTIKELQTLAPAIDWLGCLRATFHPHPVSQSDHVLLHNLPYIIHMSRVISKCGPLHTFMVFSLLHTVIPALDSRFAQTEKKFSSALGTEEEVSDMWTTHDRFSLAFELLCLWLINLEKLLCLSIFCPSLSITPFLSRNELIFPIGMFVQPLFHPTYPRAVNFGVLGTLMAKDILQLLLPNSKAPICSLGYSFLLPFLSHTIYLSVSQAYKESLKKYPWDFTLSGLSHIHLFLTSFIRVGITVDQQL